MDASDLNEYNSEVGEDMGILDNNNHQQGHEGEEGKTGGDE
jgi:hypothetical protein